jgi:hypothetical protein
MEDGTDLVNQSLTELILVVPAARRTYAYAEAYHANHASILCKGQIHVAIHAECWYDANVADKF